MTRFLFVLFSMSLLIKSPAIADEKPKLLEVSSDFDQKETLINLNFSARLPFSTSKVEDHETFLHIPVPGVILEKSQEFFNAKGPYISKVAAFKFSSKESAIRLFVKKEAKILKDALSLDILNDRLVLSLDHKKLEAKGLKDHLTKMDVPPVSEVVKNVKVREDIADPASQIPGLIGATKKNAPENIMAEKLGIVAGFLGFMIAVLLGFLYLKRKYAMREFMPGAEGATTMKSLATYPLAPKKNLNLIQIGQQKILLGVSPESIHFLTNIEPDTPSGYQEAQIDKNQKRDRFQDLLIAKANTVPPTPKKESYAGAATKQKKKAAPLAGQAKKPVQTKTPKAKKTKQNNAKKQNAMLAHTDKNVALQDVTSLIRQKLKDLPRL